MKRWFTNVYDVDTIRSTLQTLSVVLREFFRDSGDFLAPDSNRGYVVKDRTNGNYYRIYCDGGVLHTEIVTDP